MHSDLCCAPCYLPQLSSDTDTSICRHRLQPSGCSSIIAEICQLSSLNIAETSALVLIQHRKPRALMSFWLNLGEAKCWTYGCPGWEVSVRVSWHKPGDHRERAGMQVLAPRRISAVCHVQKQLWCVRGRVLKCSWKLRLWNTWPTLLGMYSSASVEGKQAGQLQPELCALLGLFLLNKLVSQVIKLTQVSWTGMCWWFEDWRQPKFQLLLHW